MNPSWFTHGVLSFYRISSSPAGDKKCGEEPELERTETCPLKDDSVIGDIISYFPMLSCLFMKGKAGAKLKIVKNQT